jgi:hypothetical protein
LNCHDLQGIIESCGSLAAISFFRRMKLRKSIAGAAVAALALAACDDTNPFGATLPTVEDSYTIFALTGTPPAYPSGLNTAARAAVRVDGNASFDVAFDINAEGNAVLYPVKLVVSQIGGDRPVGLRKVAAAFDSVTSAPTGTYPTDSAVVAGKGEVIVVEAFRGTGGDICAFNITQNIYTKILIDSIDLVGRTINIKTVMDPNCGFRSFAAGIPEK